MKEKRKQHKAMKETIEPTTNLFQYFSSFCVLCILYIEEIETKGIFMFALSARRKTRNEK